MPTAGGKVFDQVFVGVADHIQGADAAGLEVQLRFGEVLQQVAQDGVLLLLLAEAVGIEGDVLEHALARVLELGAIGLFDGMQRLVDTLAVARLVALLVQGVEAGSLRQHKALALHHLQDQLRLVAVFLLILIVVVLPYIGDVLEEQHGEDEVLVGIGADGATEGVTGIPQGLVDAVLIDFVAHDYSSVCFLASFLARVASFCMLCSGLGRFSGMVPPSSSMVSRTLRPTS